MRSLIFVFLLLVGLSSFSQDFDTIKSKQFFEFEKYNNGKSKKLKTNTSLEVVFSKEDTIHAQSGELINLNDSLLTINLSFEDFKIKKENYAFKEELTYEPPKQISIPINSIDYLSYESKGTSVFASLGGLSLLTALIIAPLVSIDRNEPYNFNSKRYTNIMRPALIGTAIGLTIYYSIGKDTMIKIKIPTKKTFNVN